MEALGVGHVAGRKIIVELDVRCEAYTREGAFEKVVTEQGVVRNPILEDLGEGSEIVDSLPHERAFCEDILVYVGDYVGVGIESGLSRKKLGKPRTRGRCERDRYARLDQCVPVYYTTSMRIDNGTIHGVSDSSNQLLCHVAAKLGVAVEGYHVPNALQLLWISCR
jgi:hypothetical protein